MSTHPFHPDLLTQIAAEHGTPVYVYDEATVMQRIDELKAHLTGIPVRLLYAMKANHCPPLLDVMRRAGLGIDAVSPGELELVLRLGFDPAHILYSANNMTDEEMRHAVEAGVTMNVGELSRLERLGATFGGLDVCVRINPQIGAGHHAHVVTGGDRSKFGIPVEQMDRVLDIAARYDLRIVGLHQHIGSGILDTETLWSAAAVILDTARSVEHLRFINVGGGLGVPYRPGEAPLDLEAFESTIVASIRDFVASHPSKGLEIRFEPGRYFTAESGLLLSRVSTIKTTGSRTFAGLDTGMGHLLRPALYDAWHTICNLTRPQGTPRTYDVVGNVCESADFFARDRDIPELREGDIVAILDAGAYGMSLSSTYNMRPLPAEVWIHPDGTPERIRRRLSASEFATAYLSDYGRLTAAV